MTSPLTAQEEAAYEASVEEALVAPSETAAVKPPRRTRTVEEQLAALCDTKRRALEKLRAKRLQLQTQLDLVTNQEQGASAELLRLEAALGEPRPPMGILGRQPSDELAAQ